MNCYTHAPWQAKPIGTINGEPADWQITDGSGVIATIESHNEADAKLIAAAPELLMFLRDAREALFARNIDELEAILAGDWCSMVVESLISSKEAV